MACALLLHGLTGSRSEMRPLAEFLHQRLGWKTEVPLLPGHETDLADLATQKLSDWTCAVDQAIEKARTHETHIHLVGLSMGALLAVDRYLRNPEGIASLALLAPVVHFRRWEQRLAAHMSRYRWMQRAIPVLPKVNPVKLAGRFSYDGYPTAAFAQFNQLRKRILGMPKLASCPTFIAVSLTDDGVDPKSALFLREHLCHEKGMSLVLSDSIHVMTLGNERDHLFGKLLEWYESLAV